MTENEKVWAVVTPSILAEINSIRDKAEENFWFRPSIGAVVLGLIKDGLKHRKIALDNSHVSRVCQSVLSDGT